MMSIAPLLKTKMNDVAIKSANTIHIDPNLSNLIVMKRKKNDAVKI